LNEMVFKLVENLFLNPILNSDKGFG
jgi:hypothetical protein